MRNGLASLLIIIGILALRFTDRLQHPWDLIVGALPIALILFAIATIMRQAGAAKRPPTSDGSSAG